MTDEQIIKRMAEIEGWYVEEIHGHVRLWVDENFCESGDTYGIVDPLTNWSDLGPLIEKYVQTVEKHADSPNIKEYWRGKYTVLTLDDAGVATHESLPHAICLAIIEANGGMGDE